MSAGFTPGPWVVTGHGTIWVNGDGRDNGVSLVANVFDENGRHKTQRALANAHLIAAAPDLYEACERIKTEKAPAYHDCIDNGEGECAWCAVFNALSKARGEQA